MYLDANARTHAAIAYPHHAEIRVEVWEKGVPVGVSEASQILGGGVNDQWVSGPRRTLDISVEPTKEWRSWLRVGVELRPFRAVRFGPDDIEDCPLGRFPVKKFSFPLASRNPISVRAQDRWQRIIANPLPYPIKAYPGLVVNAVAKLIHDVEPNELPVQILSKSQARTAPVRWDKTRVETISDLLTAIGAEAFYDRDGRPVIRDIPDIGSPVGTIRAKRGGTILELTEELDWENVVNRVGVYCSSTETTLKPVWIGVTDKASLARGPGWQTVRYASPTFTTRQQMFDAANAILKKGAGPARQYSATVIPNAGYDASDTVRIQTDMSTDDIADMDIAQIKQVTHPLSAGDSQQITTIETVVSLASDI